MSFAPFKTTDRVLGGFRERSHKQFFEYSEEPNAKLPFPEYPVKVWVTDKSIGSVATMSQFRWAQVLKTVAHIVIDEDADGKPVVEKWNIKDHRQYS